MRLVVVFVLLAGCGQSGELGGDGGADLAASTDGDPAGADLGGLDLAGDALPGFDGGAPTVLGGVQFPWSVWDGTVPDVPPAAAPGKTYYLDAKSGDDGRDGLTFAQAKRTLGPLLPALRAGDVVLLGGGVYRERPNFNNLLGGSAAAPVVIGAYGRGTGAPILDGGIKPGAWTRYTAGGQSQIWQTSTSGIAALATRPVLGVYVNDGVREAALREVIHGQVTRYASDPLPPNQTQLDLKDGSNRWYYDAAARVLYADFGGTLGGGDPNAADVSLLYNSSDNKEPLIVLTAGHDHIHFIGLTVRAASWHALYSEASGIVFDRCDVKFNGGGGLFFAAGTGDLTVKGNRATGNRIWMNVLANWPRFNNGYTGGGWPGALSFYSQSDVVARGNAVHGNGGEGLILWGTGGAGGTAHVSTNNAVRNNVIFDNFSVNLYLDNTQNARVEQNFVFDHPRDPSQTFDGLFSTSPGYDLDFGRRITPILLSLADEPGSAFDGQAHLSNITVINNVFAGEKFGFVDYDDGTTGVKHGLKGCLIAHNHIVLTGTAGQGQAPYGWRHLFSTDPSMNSSFQNNVVAVAAGAHFIETSTGAGPGIVCDRNLYSGGGTFTTNGTDQGFAAWKAAHPTWDANSQLTDAKLTDLTEFTRSAADRPVYDWSKARPATGSPAKGGGADLSGAVNTDFAGASRSGADVGAFAL